MANALKIPKNLAEVTDLYWETREERLGLDRQSKEKKSVETMLREDLIQRIPKDGKTTSVGGKYCSATVVTKEEFVVEDWNAFYAHIVKEYQRLERKEKGSGVEAFALLGRRLNETLVKEMAENGVSVPGTQKSSYVDLKISKV